MARSLHTLAALYQTLGRYTKAEPLLKRARAIREKVFGLKHSEVAWTLLDLARGYHAQGRCAEAAALRGRTEASR